MENQPLVFERTFDAPIGKIWDALTNPDQMKKWYFDVPDFKPEVGAEFSFLAGDDQKKFLHLCKVTQVIQGRKIAYTWRYDGHPGESEVSFELSPDGDKTHLKLVHAGLESFGDHPDFAKGNFVKGWTYFMDQGLPGFLSK